MGIYSGIEDKWYSFLEKLDKFVPVLGIVDRVDNYAPSFALFLIILLLILVVIVFLILSGMTPTYMYEVQVSDMQGNPINSAKINFESDCEEGGRGEVVTEKDGKASFEICSPTVSITISKSKFIPKQINLSFNGELQKISLALVPVSQKSVNVMVVDSSENMITNASLSLICMKGNDINTIEIANSKQPSSGFDFNSPSSCTTIQVKATAQGYSEKIIRLEAIDTKLLIKLEKVILKGTVIFFTDSPVGAQRAEITLTNSKSQSQKVITSLEGYFTKELEADDYTYTAIAKGSIETGSFSVNANQTKQENIYFKNLTQAAIDLIETGGAKNIYLKVLDNNTPLSSASARIFFSKNNDMNILMDLATTIDGVIGPKVILDVNLTYFALVKMKGYETKIVQVELRTANLGPQIVQMKQGGAKLRILLTDDANKPLTKANVSLYKQGFGGIFGEAQTHNTDGIVLFEDLPASTYTIKASSGVDEGQMQVSISSNDKNVTLVLYTGRGEMVFNFLNKNAKASGTFEIERKKSSSYENVYLSSTTPAALSDIIVYTKLRPVVGDGNFIPYTGLSYEVTRTRQLHDIYLRKQTDLPNAKETQLILKQAYSANPLYGRETQIKKFMPDQKTYLLFDLVLFKDQQQNANATFFIDSNYVKIQNAYSIDPSILLMSDSVLTSPIPESYTSLVYADAKEATIYFGNQNGPRMIPIILEISVDENFDGIFDLNYYSNFGQYASLNYSKQFTVGETFCIEDCPDLLFSNYLKRANKSYQPVYEGINTLLIDDNYTLKTAVRNISDKDFNQTNLIWWIESNDKNYFVFFGNKDKSTRSITLYPFSSPGAKEEIIIPKKPTSAVRQIFETVSLDTTNPSSPRDAFYVAVRNKEILQIDLFATDVKNVLYEKSYYYNVFIKTKFASGQVTPAYWKIYLDGFESAPIKEGYTNAEGEETTSLDLTNISKGAKLILYSEDENGAVPARREIIVSSYFPEVPIVPAECLKVYVAGTQVTGEAQIVVDVNSTASFVVKSECTQSKTITLQTDLDITQGKQISIPANTEQTFTIVPLASVQLRNGLLGAYPLKVISNSSAQSTLASLDVIVSDETSCFELTDAVFDFRQTEKIASKVKNKCFEGRKDNFYPKLNVLTNSVALAYRKPGNPATINFTAHVIASGIESFVQSTIGSSILHLKQDGKDIVAVPVGGSQAGSLRCFDALISNLDGLYYDGNYVPKPEPDLNITNPQMPLYRMPTPADWDMAVSKDNIKSKIDFATYNSDAFPKSVRTGDGGELIPGTVDTFPVYWQSTFSGENLTAADMNEMGVSTSVANDWNQWYTDNNTCTPRTCDAIYQSALTGAESKMHNPPGYHRLYSTSSTIAEYFGWPVYLWNNVDAEGISASGSIGRIDLAMGKCENGSCGLVMGQCNGAYCMGIDGQYYNMGTPERWYLNAPNWISLVEQGGNCYNIIYDSGCGDANADGYSYCMIQDGGYLGSGRSYLKYYLEGDTEDTTWGGEVTIRTAELKTQFEWERGSEMANERKAYWAKDVNLPTVEGSVRLVGNYGGQISPEMMWTNVTETSEGLETGEGYALPLSYYTVGVIHANGLVNPERTASYNETATAYGCVLGDTECEENLDMFSFSEEKNCKEDPYAENCRYVKWVIRPAADPLVEYDLQGKIMYYIPQDTIPGYLDGFPTVRMFLKGGNVYAEYIGKPEIASKNIDFNITKVNLYGEEYAIVTIADWVDGERKEERAFQIKLKGNPSSCYANDGTAGYSGQQFVPRINFNWDWPQTAYNYCDTKNPDYYYCDATQFTTSLFKRLKMINDLKATGKDSEIPKYSAFYAALIKDNYNQNFLLDYDEFYSSALANTANFFNSAGGSNGYDQFITSLNSAGQNRLKFKVRDSSGQVTDISQLPKPGIYRVEINTVFDNQNVPLLMDNNSPNATIEVIFKFEQSPPNNNPLYFIPFDGEVGKKGNNYVRSNYGASIQGEIPLNDSFTARQYSNSFTSLNAIKSNDLIILNNKLLLQADKTNIYFLPAQPTPLLLTVKGINGRGVAEYQFFGSGSSSALVNDWYMTNSSIYSGPRCYDFENKNQYIYSPIDEGLGKKLLSWNGTKDGTIALQTVIMAPKNTVDTLTVKLLTEPTKATIDSYDAITSATVVQLNNRQMDEYDYSTLKKMFDAVSRSDACISYNNEESLKIWWNPAHLQQLMSQVNTNPTHRCVDWTTS